MRKKELLIAAAVAALVAGTGVAGAQSNPSSSAPAEKSAPAASHKGGASQLQMNEDKGAKAGRSETTGQAPGSSGQSGAAQRQSQPSTGQSQPGATQNQMSPGGSSAQSPANQNRQGGAASGDANVSASVNLTSEQKSRIHEVIVKERNAPRVANVNFSLTVGTAVPRSVKLVRVPRTIVEIQPAWRDFEYFLVGDQIVIVNPKTLKIVAVIEA